MAAPRYRVSLHVDPAFERRVRRRSLAARARRALDLERVAAPAMLSLVITGDKAVHELNRRYLGIDEPTDVLSFGLADGDFVTPDVAAPQLGEIVISFPTAKRQAEAAGVSVDDELAHLVVHGVLHLLGYDHELPGDERAMRAREEAILGREAH